MLEDVLCELCLQALTLDDARAGGSVIISTTTAAHSALDLSKFETDEWLYESGTGHHWEHGYKLSSCDNRSRSDIKEGLGRRQCIAAMAPERTTIAPALKELISNSKSGFGACQFCQALKDILTKTYHSRSWWRTEGRCLRFRIRYQWVCRIVEHKEQEYKLTGVTVPVNTLPPGATSTRIQVLQFALAAWPGKLCLPCVPTKRYRNADVCRTLPRLATY
jgi:hypothetical protein